MRKTRIHNRDRTILIDSHIHLDFPVFDVDRPALINQAVASGIGQFVVPATTRDSWVNIRQLARDDRRAYAAYGIHPYFIDGHTLEDVEALDGWLKKNNAVAVGEIGLDYYLQELNRDKQRILFDAQLVIARKHGLPVILHARKAIHEVTDKLKKHNINKGIVHSFNGSLEQADTLIGMGFKLGFGGALTYPRATRLRELVKKLPLETICLETDAPDQPTPGFRGERNEPIALLEVLETVASLKGQAVEIIAAQTTENTYAALNIC